MTDQEKIEFVAVNVMEWRKTFSETIQCWASVNRILITDNNGIEMYVNNELGGFDPLHDHNHAAMVKRAMRDKGYRFSIEDIVNNRLQKVIWVVVSKGLYMLAESEDEDELCALIDAIIEIIQKEQSKNE